MCIGGFVGIDGVWAVMDQYGIANESRYWRLLGRKCL